MKIKNLKKFKKFKKDCESFIKKELLELESYLRHAPAKEDDTIQHKLDKLSHSVLQLDACPDWGMYVLGEVLFDSYFSPELRYTVLNEFGENLDLLKNSDLFKDGCLSILQTDVDERYSQLLYHLILRTSCESLKDCERLIKAGIAVGKWDISLDKLRDIKYDSSESGVLSRWYFYNLLSEIKNTGAVTPETNYLDDIFDPENSKYITRCLFTNRVDVVLEEGVPLGVITLSRMYYYTSAGNYIILENETSNKMGSIYQDLRLNLRYTLLDSDLRSCITNNTLVEQDVSFVEGHFIKGDEASLFCFSSVIPRRDDLNFKYFESKELLGSDKEFSGFELKFDNPLYLPKSLHSYLDPLKKANVKSSACSVFIPTYYDECLIILECLIGTDLVEQYTNPYGYDDDK